jgi:hypothetical protein
MGHRFTGERCNVILRRTLAAQEDHGGVPIYHFEGTVAELPRLQSQNGDTGNLHQAQRGGVHHPLVAASGDQDRDTACGQIVDSGVSLSGIDRCRRQQGGARLGHVLTERVKDRGMLRQGDKQRTGGGIRLFGAAGAHQTWQRTRKTAFRGQGQAPGRIRHKPRVKKAKDFTRIA